jgi:hypothetical protein
MRLAIRALASPAHSSADEMRQVFGSIAAEAHFEAGSAVARVSSSAIAPTSFQGSWRNVGGVADWLRPHSFRSVPVTEMERGGSAHPLTARPRSGSFIGSAGGPTR